MSKYSSDEVVVIRGYDIGSEDFSAMVARLPVTLRPSQLYLLATNLPGMERQNWLDKGFILVPSFHWVLWNLNVGIHQINENLFFCKKENASICTIIPQDYPKLSL